MAAFPIDANYIKARAGLLDVMDAMGPLRGAAVLVGAQAVYEYTREYDADFAVAPLTFDADVALAPELLVDDPRIPEAMAAAGYNLTDQPGIYKRDDGTQVDLLVPERVGGRRGRGASLGVHGNRAARQVRGLEGALVSHRVMAITGLGPLDDRSYDMRTAGPAALIVAKTHKIMDRSNEPGTTRLNDKDAFDVFRILRSLDTQELAAETQALLDHHLSRDVTVEALSFFGDLFGAVTATGIQMIVRSVRGLEDSDVVAASAVELSLDLTSQISNEC